MFMLIGAYNNLIDRVIVDLASCGQGEYSIMHVYMMGVIMNSR